MPEINVNVYGPEDSWVEAAGYDTGEHELDDKYKLKKTMPVHSLVDGSYMEVNTPWDLSVSYCGLGTESGASHTKIVRALITHYQDASEWDGSNWEGLMIREDGVDDRMVTNFGLGTTAIDAYKAHHGGVQFKSYWRRPLEAYGPIYQRWAPDSESYWGGNNVDNWCFNQSSEIITQIPVKNLVAIPYLVVCKSIENKINSGHEFVVTVDLKTYLTVTDPQSTSEYNYKNYPYVLRAYMGFYYSDDSEDLTTHTRGHGASFNSLFILDEQNTYADVNPDNVAEGEPGYDFGACYVYFTGVNQYYDSGITLLGPATNIWEYDSNDYEWDISYSPGSVTVSSGGQAPSNLAEITNANPYGPVIFGYDKLTETAHFEANPQSASEAYQGWFTWTYEVTDSNKNDFKELIRKEVACYGLFFVDGVDDRNKALDENGMFLGILENGVGHGKYSEGADNRNQDQWNWDDMYENDYDPSSYDPDESRPDSNPILPSDPNFTVAGRGTACYAMTYLDIDEVMEDIFGSTDAKYKELVAGLAMFGSNPMNAFVSCKWYPFVFSSQQNSPVVLGSTIVNRNHQYNVIDSTASSYYKFTCDANVKCDKNFVYSRRTKARLFLPFYGFYELPMNMVMSYKVHLEFHYNVPDEMAVWIISFGNKIYDFVECDPSIEIPLTGDNAREIMLTKRQIAMNYAAAGLTLIASAATGGVMGLMSEPATSVGMFAKQAATEGLSVMAKTAALGAVGTAALNKITNLSRNLGNLSVNVPTHGASGATTMLNLPLYPYIQLYTNDLIEGFSEAEYKLKVGIACDKWCKVDKMPTDSLLKTTGLANMSTGGMEMSEAQELNEILQGGFYR